MRRWCAWVCALVIFVLGLVGDANAVVICVDCPPPPPDPDPLVTVTHTNDTGGATMAQASSFNVYVTLSYNGEGTLTGVGTSAQWDSSELLLTNATTAPSSVLPGASGALSKVSDPMQFPGDPTGTLRTVQYLANSGQSASAGLELITTLTFQVIGGFDGIADVGVMLNSGDGCFGALGALCGPGEFVLVGTSIAYDVVPEPSTALLLSLGLTGLGFSGRRK